MISQKCCILPHEINEENRNRSVIIRNPWKFWERYINPGSFIDEFYFYFIDEFYINEILSLFIISIFYLNLSALQMKESLESGR